MFGAKGIIVARKQWIYDHNLLKNWQSVSAATTLFLPYQTINMREIVHLQTGQCGNQIGAKVRCEMSVVFNAIFYDISVVYHGCYFY